MGIVDTNPLTVRITPEARKILERVGNSLVDQKDRLPLGRIVTAMVKFLEEDECWDAITEIIRADFAREAHERRVRDRERKRPKRTAGVIRGRGKTETEKVAARRTGGISRGEVGKLRRALTKAGKQPSEAAIKAFYDRLKADGIDPMSKSSYQLSKLVAQDATARQ
jgi:hypothetical protein